MKKLAWKPNPRGIGLDVGWLLDSGTSIKWGNCKGPEQLPMLLADCQNDEQHRGVTEIVELEGDWDIGGRKR